MCQHAIPEALHDAVSLLLRHVPMHGSYSEVVLCHLLCQPVNLSLSIAEDDCLSDGEGVIQVTEGVKLPLLLLNCHKELLDALQQSDTVEQVSRTWEGR